MALLRNIKNLRNRLLLNAAKGADPQQLVRRSADEAVRAFHRAYDRFPAYRSICTAHNVPDHKIADLASFQQHVPRLDKRALFYPENAQSVLNDIELATVSSVLMSSGSTGKFGFGLSSAQEARDSMLMLEVMMEDFFQITSQKTLLINCLPQAVKLPGIAITLAEIGPRADSLSFLLRTMASRFDQTIIVGDNIFLKNALEEAAEGGVDLQTLKIHLIVGGSYLPESLRRYLMILLHINAEDPKTGSIFSSMGISEFGLNLFFESRETVKLRGLAYEDKEFRERLLGKDAPFLPMFFNYLPQSIFVEKSGGTLLITSLNDKTLLPLIRYDSGDAGDLIGYEDLKKLLGTRGSPEFLPRFHSPLALLYGRTDSLTWRGRAIYPNAIQDAIYREARLARDITGNFRLSIENDQPCLKIQLKTGRGASKIAPADVTSALASCLDTNIAVQLFAFQDFPAGMSLDYERKLKFI